MAEAGGEAEAEAEAEDEAFGEGFYFGHNENFDDMSRAWQEL